MSPDSQMWTPSDARATSSNVYEFIKCLQAKGVTVSGFQDLLRWSIQNSEQFWVELWEYCKIIGERTGSAVIHADAMEKATWFPKSRLNFSENLLKHRSNKTALIEIDQSGNRFEVSYDDLRTRSQAVAQHLRNRGVNPGDVVAGVMDNSIPTVVACLAAAQLGAVWTACSLDLGLEGIVERLGQVKPEVLFTVSPSASKKAFMTMRKLEDICERIPSIDEVVICKGAAGRLTIGASVKATDFENIFGTPGYEDYPSFPFNQPLYILYSSGTTGAPKCILHGAGGTLLQHVKELGLHVGLESNDTIFFYTSCGWMMWNWLVSSLFFGATIVLYGGSPIFPGPQRLFDICRSEGVTVLGANPRYLQACHKSSVEFDLEDGLPDLATLLSTGSVLQPYLYDYVYSHIKRDVLLSSISGGSDIISCFCLGSEMLPVHRGESQTIGLGMDVACFSDNGQSIETGKGELVCRNAIPSRPLGFWGDSTGEKFHKAYFERFPNIWTHGDFIEFTSNKGIVFHGRSDTTLNVGGVRVGTGEIYKQLGKVAEVVEAVAVEQAWRGDSRMLLFLTMMPGCQLDKSLQRKTRKLLRENLSEDHVPNKIMAVPDFPRTFSGKTVELAIKAVVNRQDVKNEAAIENPEALDYFRTFEGIYE